MMIHREVSLKIKNMKLHIKYIAVIFICLVLCGVRCDDNLEKVIIDTDAGPDDAVAIFLTLRSQCAGVEVIAITCSYGNTYLDNVVQNVLKVLTVANRSDIPVYKGASKALINEYKPTGYFGSDGFGDFNFTDEITAKVDESKHAAVALVDLAKQYPGQITVLSIGPLTNIAIAIALEPMFLKYLKNHVILGSSVSGIGNILPNVEFNFYQDPESNYIVMNSIMNDNNSVPRTLVSWELGVDSYISKDWRINTLGKINSTAMRLLNKAEQVSLMNSTSWVVSDAVAAAIMIWPQFAQSSTVVNVSPVIDGMARGSVLVDYTNLTDKPRNTRIPKTFSMEAFKSEILRSLS
ncbi:uncharacterized protein LOC128897017 isoform X2 [Hylaeus anthracinus]|uniref:uncharacterized protein LOC128897017 isoform X1 n=2 Tax=Hylaeus anthracinus TaxID=313031 RepID=UPI0023B972B7|nr:uncharacterized protein LOC128897017 isoform X1 [Hylaeus anthracinus]XP_054016617.1 uncharacterized protein LOC128897017 isoform X2 [Hylaeus anthracinus]